MWTEVFMPISIIGTFGASVYFFTKVLTDYILKKKMIEKGYVSDETQGIFKSYSDVNKYGSLKWGLLFLGAGTAFIVMHIMDVDPQTPLPYGIFTVAVSAGFLIYYFLVKNEARK